MFIESLSPNTIAIDPWVNNSYNVPVTPMKTNTIRAKILGHRNNITKLNVFTKQGAIIGYTRSPLLLAPGNNTEYDKRWVHTNEAEIEFQNCRKEFHS